MGALTLSIPETVLIYVGIPAAIVLVVAGVIFAGGSRRSKRYRPGRPYDFKPVWFTAAPEGPAAAGRHEPATGTEPAMLPAAVVAPSPTGGASDRW